MKRFYNLSFFAFFVLLVAATVSAQEYRTLDGTLNNPNDPNWGAANAHQPHSGTVGYADGYAAPAGADRPNPRHISNLIFNQSSLGNDPRGLSAYAWAWGQFIDHDITLVPDNPTDPFPISVPPYDFYFDPTGSGTAQIPMFRSIYDPATGLDPGNPRIHVNKITAFIDGSAVYGSDFGRASWLRMYSKGKLKLSDGKLLPFNTVTGELSAPLDQFAPEMAMPMPFVQKWFVAGDVRANENPFLLALHTLFAREHNRICLELIAEHPSWSDGELYEEARRRVGALMQAVTYEEWLPTLGIHLPAYTGYRPAVNPNIENVFSAAAYRYGHTTINSVLVRMDNDGNYIPQGNIMLRDAFFNPNATVDIGGIEPYLIGMSTVVEQDFDCKVIDELRNFLFGPPGAGGMDLVALNIQRGRDRGLPDYNTVRADNGLPEKTSFSEITGDPLMNMALQNLYQDVNAIDPWVGMLAEDHMPDALFGQTAMVIITRQFTALRDGDRFYYENDPAFTPEEIEEIKNTRLADIIRRNTPIFSIHDNVFMAQPLVTPTRDLAGSSSAMTVYPNPATDYLNLEFEHTQTEAAQLLFYDPLGRLVLTQNLSLHAGLNRFNVQIPPNLTPGLYRLAVLANGANRHASFIKK